MKKKIAATVLILGLTMTTAASANWNGGRGSGNCQQGQMQKWQNLDPAIKAQVKKFRVDNQAMFKEMAMKRAEKRAMMKGTNPDPKQVAQLTGELFDLRTTLQLKADEAGIAQYVGPMLKGRSEGRGKHGGMGKRQNQMIN